MGLFNPKTLLAELPGNQDVYLDKGLTNGTKYSYGIKSISIYGFETDIIGLMIVTPVPGEFLHIPLDLGNSWTYAEGRWTPEDGNVIFDTVTYTVESTIVPSNGKTYFQIPGNWFYHSEYLREDSLGVYFYDTTCAKEELVYSFKLNPDVEPPLDTLLRVGWNSCGNMDSATIFREPLENYWLFGESEPYANFSHDAGIDKDVFTIGLSRHYGFISWYQPDLNGFNYKHLIGCQIDGLKYGTFVSVNDDPFAVKTFLLEQNYPNPFNPVTTIKFSLPEMALISIIIYDPLGRELTRLVNEEKPPGIYEVNWNAVNLPSGVYFYELKARDFVQTKKMILLK